MKAADARTNKTAAICAVLAKSRRPITMEVLQPRVERKLKQVVGRQKLYTLLSVLKVNGVIDTLGRGAERAYYRVGK